MKTCFMELCSPELYMEWYSYYGWYGCEWYQINRRRLMNKAVTWILIGLLVGLLVAIRTFENALFYDPLIAFFKLDHSTQMLPNLDTFKLIGNVALRFWFNTIISLVILWLLFNKKEIIKVSILLYAIVFVVLLIAFVMLLSLSPSEPVIGETQIETGSGGHLALFYIRRFLIQPVLLLLLIPAFYFQKKT